MSNWTSFKSYIKYKPYGYSISKNQLIQDGIESWLDHLRNKTWFTNKEETDFLIAAKKLVGF